MWDTAGFPSSLLRTDRSPTKISIRDLKNRPQLLRRGAHVRTSVARISYYAALSHNRVCGFLLKKSRMKLLNATTLDRKSGIRGPKTTFFRMLSLQA
jgi:hypothetical protein